MLLDFCKNFIKNNMKKNIIKDLSLCFLLNKKELENLYFYLIKKHGYNIQYIKEPTEEMKIEAIKQSGYAIKYIKKSNSRNEIIG